MYHFITTPQRSKHMGRIKGKNTIPEIILRKALWNSGLRYRLNLKSLPGSPDIVINSRKLVVFVDGEFWHGYNWDSKKEKIKANKEYWISKIEKNMQRDLKNNEDLRGLGYTVLRFWEHEIRKDVMACVNKILSTSCEQMDY